MLLIICCGDDADADNGTRLSPLVLVVVDDDDGGNAMAEVSGETGDTVEKSLENIFRYVCKDQGLKNFKGTVVRLPLCNTCIIAFITKINMLLSYWFQVPGMRLKGPGISLLPIASFQMNLMMERQLDYWGWNLH